MAAFPLLLAAWMRRGSHLGLAPAILVLAVMGRRAVRIVDVPDAPVNRTLDLTALAEVERLRRIRRRREDQTRVPRIVLRHALFE
jgi:hypothetical protein